MTPTPLSRSSSSRRPLVLPLLFALSSALAPGLAAEPPPVAVAPPAEAAPLRVGLRRSSYGLRGRNADDAWWVARAKAFAAAFPGARPTIVQIVSIYQDDGSTEFAFAKPADDAGPTDHMSFHRPHGARAMDPERALAAYDEAGVDAILQLEPGEADVARGLDLTRRALGRHRCVVGYGIDAEWYFTRQSPDQSGRPITDAEAKAWVEAVQSFSRPTGDNPAGGAGAGPAGRELTFFLKHWDPRHLPPHYRHERLWFLDDSQEFANAAEMLADFKAWGRARGPSDTGYQFGYPKDRKWWSKLADPPAELGRRIRREVPTCRYLFWVDFTAEQVNFAPPAADEAPAGRR